MAAVSVPPFGLASGRAPGTRLAMNGVLGWRAFLVNPSFIILTRVPAEVQLQRRTLEFALRNGDNVKPNWFEDLVAVPLGVGALALRDAEGEA